MKEQIELLLRIHVAARAPRLAERIEIHFDPKQRILYEARPRGAYAVLTFGHQVTKSPIPLVTRDAVKSCKEIIYKRTVAVKLVRRDYAEAVASIEENLDLAAEELLVPLFERPLDTRRDPSWLND